MLKKRKEQLSIEKEGYHYITPRSLLAILRLAQALARLRFNDEVEQIDVDEALNLIESSRESILCDDTDKRELSQRKDIHSNIFTYFRELCTQHNNKTVKFSEFEKKMHTKRI